MLTRIPIASRLASAGRAAREFQGFTLVETLVAILAGIVVTAALFAILEVSLHQYARAGDVVQASQLGRASMSRIVDELRSSCLATEFAPVQGKSSNTVVYFRNSYSEKAVPTSASEHKIEWNEKAGTLTDFMLPSTSGSWPNFTYSGTASPAAGTLIGENISAQGTTTVKNSEGKSETIPTPIFRYYKYATAAANAEEGTNVPIGTLTQIELGSKEELGSVKAAEVASVLISIRAGATDGLYKTKGGVADFSNQVTLAVTTPNPENTIVDGPCQ
jgi:Tfp pilus assembly protein PilW